MTTTDAHDRALSALAGRSLSLAAGAIHFAEVGDFNLSWGCSLPSSPGCRLPGPWRS